MYLVTGASSGIGSAVACSLLERGESVVTVARRSMASAVLTKYGNKHTSIKADVTTESGLNAIALALEGRLVKGVVHAAGTPIALSNYADLISDEISRDILVHVSAPIAINNLLTRQLQGARILYIDSYSANAPREGWTGYSIVKAAAQMAAKAAATEISHARVVRVFPGGVRTPLVEGVLNSESLSATALAFRKLDQEGGISEPSTIGRYIANILVQATNDQLDAREFWDFSNSADHLF
ncbi:SDR family NAD(P)-dependent oxidoreductase [Granulosicoccus sp.]|nr:SDR family NAD(P)-dependent oxidoreductase [Granulosicoccus sp.]MDB4223683.1 SDR family NAD(P)-dependent oxidoreductase [Granulosicoccus sp.]